jgi:hypothetical protein
MKRIFLALAILLILPSSASAGVQAHSMLHTCCDTPEKVEQTFQAAQAMGASRVRLDVEVHGIISAQGAYDFSKLDHVLATARRYDMRVLGILSGTPPQFGDCPVGTPIQDSWKCGARDPDAYGAAVAKIIDHAPRVTWEFWNEPDLDYMYTGTPERYGQMLRALYREVKREHPGTRITFGGVAGSKSFVRRALDAGARRSFDIANVHIRGHSAVLRGITVRWRRFFKRETGRKLPLWVTEHGFPSDPKWQWDGFTGEVGQARYLKRSVTRIRRGGAREIFVTLFDSAEFGDNAYATEGVANKPAARTLARLRG